jgi:hypothetical protein
MTHKEEGEAAMKKFSTAIALLGFVLLSQAALGQINVIMSGLDNPRGLALGPDGGIYVAEAGRGGNGAEILGGEGVNVQFGATGAVSRYLGGTQFRVISGLPSLAPQTGATPGGRASGLVDIAFSGADLYGVIGFGGDPAKRALLGADGVHFAQLVKLPLGGAPINIADIGTHEATFNPDGTTVDTNAYGLHITPLGFAVADAGANDTLNITPAGLITTGAVFPARPNPLFPTVGGPTFQAVPTTVATGPDGALYVGQLTGFPFPPGAANVYRIDPITGISAVAQSGFTNIIDLAFAPDGDMLILQISSNGLATAGGPGPGKLIRIDSITGIRETLLQDPLFFPGGLLVTPSGDIYVSNFGTSPGGGQVLQVIPEPAACGLTLAALAILGLSRRRINR